MIKVLLAGDERIVLQGVKQILEEAADIVPVLEAQTADDLIEKIRVHNLVDLVVWAPNNSTAGWEEIREKIQTVRPGLPVVCLAERQMSSSQGWTWLSRNSSPEELVTVIRRAMRPAADSQAERVLYAKPESTAHEAGQISQERRQGMRKIEKSMTPALTPRQKQVLRLIAHGYANKEIAQELGISVRTVEVHRFYLMRRLKAHNVAQLFHQAIRGRFIPKNFATSGRF